MISRLPFLAALGAVLATAGACNAPSDGDLSAQLPAREEPPAAALTQQQVLERSEQCASASREAFQRDWKTVGTAEFAHHYNTRLDTCFYLLTVVGPDTRNRKLFDVNERELYGEYLGPATDESPMKALPAECKVAGLYCASGREWEVLVSYFMEQ